MIHYTRFALLSILISVTGNRLLAESSSPPAAATQPVDDTALCARSQVSLGDTARLQQVFAKARSGRPVTVSVVGGSITQGASASKPERRYGNLMAAWWRQQFPKAEINFVNAGVGATGSNYAAMRVRRDLLDKHPDFIVVEFAVNDGNTREFAESYEGLLRQILRAPGRPAVLLFFTMHNDGANAQEWQMRLGYHYHLPMVSFRDALWPEIQAGRLKWSDVEADVVHPNDRGHAYAARFITSLLANVLQSPPTSTQPAAADGTLPAPLISDLFEHVAIYQGDTLKPVSNQGWAYSPKDHHWKADKPGSTIEFEVEGTIILTMHWVIRGPQGQAKVTVDGGAPKTLEGWFDQTWGGYNQSNEIARGLASGKHRVRFELLADKNPQSTGHEFGIFNVGTALGRN